MIAVPEIFQKNKFQYWTLLVYSIGFPLLLVLTFSPFYLDLGLVSDVLLFIVFVLTIFSMIKDENKVIPALLVGFILFYLTPYVFSHLGDLGLIGGALYPFTIVLDPYSTDTGIGSVYVLMAYLPIFTFIFIILWKSWHLTLSQLQIGDGDSTYNRLQRLTKRLLISNLLPFFCNLFLFFTGLYSFLFGRYSWLNYAAIITLVNGVIFIIGFILSLILLIKHKVSWVVVFINLLGILVNLFIFGIIMMSSIAD